MLLKSKPEDFIVEEIPAIEPGNQTILKITKRLRNTEDVAKELAQKLHCERKRIGYAGAKDRQAVTTQYFSTPAIEKAPLLKDCTVEIAGTGAPLRLGMLKGNKFIITLRDVTETLALPQAIPNYFDEQRFSTSNAAIGLHLFKKEFKEAAKLISLQRNELWEEQEPPLSYITSIPRSIVKLYLHAAQSLLWNRIVAAYLQEKKTRKILYSQGEFLFPLEPIEQRDIPLPGFSTEYRDLEPIAEKILEAEHLTARDFVIRQLPNLSLEGTDRKLLIDIKDFTLKQESETAIVEFTLPPGSYATIVVKSLASPRSHS